VWRRIGDLAVGLAVMERVLYRCRRCRGLFPASKRVGLWLEVRVANWEEGELGGGEWERRILPGRARYVCGVCNVRELGVRRTSDPDSPLGRRLGVNRI